MGLMTSYYMFDIGYGTGGVSYSLYPQFRYCLKFSRG